MTLKVIDIQKEHLHFLKIHSLTLRYIFGSKSNIINNLYLYFLFALI